MKTPPNPSDLLLKFYRSRVGLPLKPRMAIPPNMTVTNLGQGLGDTMMLTGAAARGRSVFSGSPHFKEIMALVPGYRQQTTTPMLLDAPTGIVAYESGNGHFLQRLKRILGMPVGDIPLPNLDEIAATRTPIKNRVVMHFEPGYHAKWQSEHIRPRARWLSNESLKIVQAFINSHRGLEFRLVGNVGPDVTCAGTPTTTALINEIATASLFIGINSGPMHVATALGIPCIVIVNFPNAAEIMLPCLKPLGLPDEQWLYPQNVHLHQDNAGPLVPQLSVESLEAAMNGEVYPYRKTEWLPIIHERL